MRRELSWLDWLGIAICLALNIISCPKHGVQPDARISGKHARRYQRLIQVSILHAILRLQFHADDARPIEDRSDLLHDVKIVDSLSGDSRLANRIKGVMCDLSVDRRAKGTPLAG